jgi:hypothetical protein
MAPKKVIGRGKVWPIQWPCLGSATTYPMIWKTLVEILPHTSTIMRGSFITGLPDILSTWQTNSFSLKLLLSLSLQLLNFRLGYVQLFQLDVTQGTFPTSLAGISRYTLYRQSRDEKGNLNQQLNILRKYIANMIMEVKFRISKYSKVFNRVGTGKRGLTKFIIVDQYVSFSWERFKKKNTEFHEVSSAPALYRISVYFSLLMRKVK